MLPLHLLVVYEGHLAPAELLQLLAADSHKASPVSGLESALDALASEQYSAVLLASDYDTPAIERLASAVRRLDQSRSAGSGRTVLLSCAPNPPESPSVDLHLSLPDDLAELAPVIQELASFRVLSSEAAPEHGGDLPVFEPDSFEEQCAHDQELMLEIIELFAAECDEELPAIAACLESGEFERASRLAHSLKGSLGSLHAASARRRAHDLEMAARESDLVACSRSLRLLDAEISTLRTRLLEYRQTALCP